nr:ABC transporter substrate-binding protein [Clostridia bacterium]
MKKILLSLTLMLCFILSSCSAESDKNITSSNDIRESFLSAANEVTVTENSVIFTDAVSDAPTEIQKNPKRVVCMYPSYGTLWYEAGGELVGCIGGSSASEVYTEYIGRDIALDDEMTVLGTTAAGKHWDVEAVLALKPDLIICSTAMNGYGTLDAPASAADIPLIAVDYDNFSDYLKWFKVFCNLTGH